MAIVRHLGTILSKISRGEILPFVVGLLIGVTLALLISGDPYSTSIRQRFLHKAFVSELFDSFKPDPQSPCAEKSVTCYHPIFPVQEFPDNIFFIESSGSSKLNPRQACAVESAAYHYPYSKIQLVMFTSNPFQDTFGLLQSLPNINVQTIEIECFLADTPLLEWFRKTKWNNQMYRTYDLGDVGRAVVISKCGGMYLDLDTVTLRPLHGVRNFFIREDNRHIACGVYGLEKNHTFLLRYFEMLPKKHLKGTWGSLGPRLFTAVSNSFTKEKTQHKNHPKYDFTFLPTNVAYPVFYPRWKDYFNRTKTKQVLAQIKDSYFIHVWNKFSKEKRLSINSGSVYEKAMKENCPVVYGHLLRSAMLNASFVF